MWALTLLLQENVWVSTFACVFTLREEEGMANRHSLEEIVNHSTIRSRYFYNVIWHYYYDLLLEEAWITTYTLKNRERPPLHVLGEEGKAISTFLRRAILELLCIMQLPHVLAETWNLNPSISRECG